MKPSIRNTVLVMNDEKKPRDKSLGPTGHNACRDDSPIMMTVENLAIIARFSTGRIHRNLPFSCDRRLRYNEREVIELLSACNPEEYC